MQRLFAVVRTRGPAWQESRPLESQADWAGHASFMNALAREGFVVLGGPLDGTPDVLLVVRASSPDEIRSRLADDPWARHGLLSIARVTPWTLRLGSPGVAAPEKRTLAEQVAELLPTREGHFVFESGHHGQAWLDLERLFLRPERVRPLAEALADRLRRYEATAVCGPLVEGAFVGLIVASSLGLPFSYSEPARDPRATGLFPVSYPIPRSLGTTLRGQRVAIVNDVVNAGSAVRATLASLEACGARPVVIGTLAVYGGAAGDLAARHDVGLEALASFPSRIWEPSACPLCADGVPLDA